MKRFTRIDLENIGTGVVRKMWLDGWVEGNAPDEETFLEGRRMFDLLYEAERKGWSVTQYNDNEARLLKGDPIRVDLMEIDGAVRIDAYPYGWKAQTRPMSQETRSATLESVVEQYKKDGWQVRRWAGGARAWKGPLLPVRDQDAILQMRRRYSQRPGELARLSGGFIRLDFAFDL